MNNEKDMENKFYITTPIYYVNDVPHIGHAYTTIAADILARHYRQKLGTENVFFSTGTDEHGAKIAEVAKNAKMSAQEFCDLLVPKFQETWKAVNISNNAFIRSTNPKHEKIAQDFLIRLKEKGLIDKRKYEGLYCIGCERFLAESDLQDGCCPDHPNKKPVKHSEENWYFKLSKFQKPLLKAIKNGDYQILPESRKNEIISKIKMGLEDISISRAKVLWGIQIPWDTKQTVYVWIEALINYYSVLKINQKLDFWPPTVHLMAKDILWFHAVIWPAMLLALNLELPKTIFAHGFFTINGQKMSKTIGNVLDPNKWVKKYGVDAVRYYLLRAFPFGEDGNVSGKDLLEKYNNELANELGNLVNRVILMINKFQIPKNKLQKNTSEVAEGFLRGGNGQKINKLIENFQFNEAMKEIWKDVHGANEYIEQNKPWILAKTDKDKLEKVINYLVTKLRVTSYELQPFLPDTAEKIQTQFKTLKPEPLFPRIK